VLSAGPVVTEEKIQQAKVFYQMHFRQTVFDEDGWRKILKVCMAVAPTLGVFSRHTDSHLIILAWGRRCVIQLYVTIIPKMLMLWSILINSYYIH